MQELTKTRGKKIVTYRAFRNLDIGEETRTYGELVPEAPTWFRYMNLVNTGMIKEVTVTEAEYVKAVQKYCPDLAEELAPLTGVSLNKLKGK